MAKADVPNGSSSWTCEILHTPSKVPHLYQAGYQKLCRLVHRLQATKAHFVKKQQASLCKCIQHVT